MVIGHFHVFQGIIPVLGLLVTSWASVCDAADLSEAANRELDLDLLDGKRLHDQHAAMPYPGRWTLYCRDKY
jgi:hypothetical protein